MRGLIPSEQIHDRILTIRGCRVLLDADLAILYGVTTKRLNEQVKRNRRRFPEDFIFQLTSAERDEVVANCDHLKNLRFSKALPYAFTEHGAVQAANIVNSDTATEMSVHIVRAFIAQRQLLSRQKALTEKLAQLDARVGAHDEQIAGIIEAIRQLLAPPGPDHSRKIGFHRGNR